MKSLWLSPQDAVLTDLYATATRLTVDELLMDRIELSRLSQLFQSRCGVPRAPTDLGRRMLTLRKKGRLPRKVRP